MKFPCVELYFEVEVGPLDIRVWMKTNNELKDGVVPLHHYIEMDKLKGMLIGRGFVDMDKAVRFLSREESVAAFQVTYRHDMNRTATIVYREWP
jgi:hypothetical protein